MKTKFGDEIDWDYHVDQVLEEDKTMHNILHGTKDNYKHAMLARAIDYITTGSKKPYKVADCGCHVGRFIKCFQHYGLDYTGFDQSLKALETARKISPDGNFVHSFLWDIDVKEEYDIACCFAVLQHNTNEEKEIIIPKIYNMLKTGGVFFFTESTETENTRTQLTTECWIDLMDRNGFKLMETGHKNPIGFNDNYIFRK